MPINPTISLQPFKTKAIVKISDAKAIIDQQPSKLLPNGFEVITPEIARQANLIRDALREFDAKALAWIKA